MVNVQKQSVGRRGIVKLFLKLFTSGILIIVLFSQTDFRSIGDCFSKLDWQVFAFSAVCYCISVTLGAYKWHCFLNNCAIGVLVRCCFKTQFYSTVLPGQLFGEASKVVDLQRIKIDNRKIVTSVIADKLTGLIGLVIVGITGVVRTKADIPTVLRFIFVLFAIVLLSICLFPRVTFLDRNVLKGIRCCWKITGRKGNHFIHLVYKMYCIWKYYACQKGILLKTIFGGFVIQMAGAVQIWGIARLIHVAVPLTEFMWIIAAVSLLLLLPISFGGVGVREISIAGFLALCNVSTDISIVISTVLLSSQVVAAILGLIFMIYDQIKDNV